MCNCIDDKCGGSGLDKLDWNQYENSKSSYANQTYMIQENNNYGGMNNGYSA